MKIALIGYGAMGQLVAKLAKEAEHEIAVTLTSEDAKRGADEVVSDLSDCDVAIDFSVAAAVPNNVAVCLRAGIPVVEGTTGWNLEVHELGRAVVDADGALIYGSNFSVGAQIFFRIAASAAGQL